ncbi:MAG: hypothetical protein M3Z50_10070 [Actinomycetota bacterium]|nr:hypothetical protein [Actinomycetota bacterium]
MTEPAVDEKDWPTKCPECGTELQHAVVDFDETNEKRAEMNPGEMVALDFCPNPDCPTNSPVDTES